MKNNNFKIELLKEVYQGKEFTLPYREYVVSYHDEEYHVTVDDKIYGNNGGSYKANVFFIKSNIDREKKEIYFYNYNEKNVNEKYNKNYSDIIDYLFNSKLIKKIVIKKENELE